MDRESRAVIDAVQSFKRRAPKLKPGDRTISLALDAFAAASSHQKQTKSGTNSVASGVAISPNLLIDNNMIIPPPLLQHVAGATSPIQEFKKSNHFYMESSNNTSNSYPDYSQHHPHPHTHQMSRKPNIRRSDTLDVYGTGTFEMRKATSFIANETDQMPSDVSISRRTNSMRHTIQTPSHPYGMIDDIGLISSPNSLIAAETTAANNRRNCRMHKSFHDRSRHHDVKNEMCIDTVKCHSLGDDGSDNNLNVAITKRKLSPKFNSAESSLENEVFYTRSGSRGEMNSTSIDGIDGIDNNEQSIMGNAPIPIASTSLSNARKSSATITHKHSSQSLDKPHNNFRRIARATQSFYLNSNQSEELRTHRSVHGGTVIGANDPKRISASMRGKPFRDVVAEPKKSKSFITDPFASGSTEFELSPLRQDAIADVRKSPRSLSAYETKKLTNFNGNDMDYDIVSAYRQSRRKSSILSAGGGGGGGDGGGGARKTNKKKIRNDSNANDGNEIDEDGDTESSRKRKRIVCFVVSVVLSLVFATVFVVVFTLTYSSMAQASDYTKRIHNFAPGPGNRDSPIHHHNGNFEHLFIKEYDKIKYKIYKHENTKTQQNRIYISYLVVLNVAWVFANISRHKFIKYSTFNGSENSF